MAAARSHFNLTQTANTTSEATWQHSPVPYLFGGLAAMLGLIAFALLILACSYWKLSGYLGGDSGEGDLEAGRQRNNDMADKKTEFEEKVLVIMAGQTDPTFIATPMTSRSSSFGDSSVKTSSSFCTCESGSHSGKLEVVAEDSKQVTEPSPENNEEGQRSESV